MLENKAQNSSGKQALRSTKFHALSRVIKEGYSGLQVGAGQLFFKAFLEIRFNI